VGLVRWKERVLWKPGLVAEVELGLWVGTWPLSHLSSIMPKIKTTRTKKAPEGFEEIEPVSMLYCFQCNPRWSALSKILDDYARKMRDAENESHEGKRKSESLWPIMRISHARSRYIYELYYKREAISKELYDWLLKEKYGDVK
jgi:bud site selection protein 31